MKPFDGRPIRNSLSRFKGVTRHSGRWIARYYFAKYQPHIIGSCETKEDAARAYDDFALTPLAAGGRFRINLADLPLVSQYYLERRQERWSRRE